MLDKKAKYIVTSKGIVKKTNKPFKVKGKLFIREEEIDLNDPVFNGDCRKVESISDIKASYESFWNHSFSKILVEVTGIEVKF